MTMGTVLTMLSMNIEECRSSSSKEFLFLILIFPDLFSNRRDILCYLELTYFRELHSYRLFGFPFLFPSNVDVFMCSRPSTLGR